jgi:hypothetical protein
VIDDMSTISAPDLAFSRTVRDGLDLRGGGHHRDDDVGVPDGLGDGLRRRTAGGGEPVQLVLLQGVTGDGVTRLDQVLGHGGAHDAEADPRDLGKVAHEGASPAALKLVVRR